MQKLLLLLIILFFVNTLFAQKNFEGKIVYSIYSPEDTSRKKNITVYLKGDKMFIDNNESKKNLSQSFSLYDFGKALTYMFNYDDSLAIYSKITRTPFPYSSLEIDSIDLIVKIAGYNCHKRSSLIFPPMNNYFKKIENWFTDKIFFKVNDTAQFIMPPFIFFNENSISLKTKINLDKKMPEIQDIIIEATEIKEGYIDASKFEIPKNMKVVSVETYSKSILEKFKAVDNELPNENEILEHQSKPVPKKDKPVQSNKNIPPQKIKNKRS